MKFTNFVIMVLCMPSLLYAITTQEPTRNFVLLGSIQFESSLDQALEFPILYKGNEYEAKVEEKGDRKKAHFELYEQTKPAELFIIVTEYLKLPTNPTIKHLFTSTNHPYRLFKLISVGSNHTNKTGKVLATKDNDPYNCWLIEELNNTIKSAAIPDNTIIFFMNPALIDHLEPISWQQESSIIQLPTIVLKKNILKETINDLAIKMKLALLDFKFFHKKINQALIPYANNRIISMPFSPQKTVA